MRTALLLCLLGVAGSRAAAAQSDSTPSPLVTTIRLWAEDAWFTILDRDAAAGGRFSEDGILQRFQPSIDPDYQVDKIRWAFSMLDNTEWYRQTSGARCYAGSVTTTTFAEGCTFVQSVNMGRQWSAVLHFDTQHTPEVDRSLPRLGFVRTASNGVFWSVETTLVPFKPSTALETGFGWRHPQDGRELAVYFGMLAAFSNFIYQGIGLVGVNSGDSLQDYTRRPYSIRVNFEQPIGAKWRLETRVGIVPLSTVRRYSRWVTDSGFSQDEEYGFAGSLVQYQATPRLTLGGFATYVHAMIDRVPSVYAPPEMNFRVTESETHAGGLVLARLGRDWVSTNWLGYVWRPYMKTYRSGTSSDVDYEDVAWAGMVSIERRPARGATGLLAWEWYLMDVTRGVGEVPGMSEAPMGRHKKELRFEFGYRYARRYAFQAGIAVNTPPTSDPRGWFGGGEGRFALYW